MPTREDLLRFGTEVRRKRTALGSTSLRAFARQLQISPTHLSQIERAYVHPKRGLIVPSDDVLLKLSQGLDIPLSRLHALLGRLPDQPFPVFNNPETVDLAERYDQLPNYAQAIMKDVLESLERNSHSV